MNKLYIVEVNKLRELYLSGQLYNNALHDFEEIDILNPDYKIFICSYSKSKCQLTIL